VGAMSDSRMWASSSREYPYWATAASLAARKRSSSTANTHIGCGLVSKRKRKLRSRTRSPSTAPRIRMPPIATVPSTMRPPSGIAGALLPRLP
jgi:hypothetical protein